ncbi:hypothetical protein A0H81_07329 [Grifola frondosa]|uniref:F-box domain-containing protein n=1 Tax=Grifola frondosa TaxID=5627 RepID=A0A1C7M9Y1_GRIFR|nr:hypothetical protein A0H81_07329 [Grifola frondosa]
MHPPAQCPLCAVLTPVSFSSGATSQILNAAAKMKGSSRSAISEDISLKELAEVLLCRAQEAASNDASKMSLELIRDLDRILTSTLCIVRDMLDSRQRSISLPPEILSAIFQFVPRSPRINGDDLVCEPANVNTMELIPLTTVCHRWREIALSIPSLWSSISDRHPPSFLERSRSEDLILTVTKEPKADHFMYDLLRSGGSRIREMYWREMYWRVNLSLHLAFPAPRLRVLHLSLQCGCLPPGAVLFQGHTPQLEYLTLRSYYGTPSESILSLTHLCLSNIQDIGLDDTLSLLSKTPNLENLVVKGVYVWGPSKTSSVPLKNLTRLTLELMETEPVSSLISHLEISPSVVVQAIYCGSDDEYNAFCSLFTALSFIPTKLEVAGIPRHSGGVVISAVNSSSALRCISGACLFFHQRSLREVEQDIREIWIHPGRDMLSTISERKWIHLETLVGCGYSLKSILKYLSTPPECPSAPGLSTIRLIQKSPYKKIGLSVGRKVKERFMLARKECAAVKLVIEHHVLQRDAGHRVTPEVEALLNPLNTSSSRRHR